MEGRIWRFPVGVGSGGGCLESGIGSVSQVKFGTWDFWLFLKLDS